MSPTKAVFYTGTFPADFLAARCAGTGLRMP